MAKEISKKHLFISGRVQGVGYRAFLANEAQKLEIKGWVKNLADGRVEAIVSGSQAKIAKIIKLAKKGPRWAQVEQVEISDYLLETNFKRFSVLY